MGHSHKFAYTRENIEEITGRSLRSIRSDEVSGKLDIHSLLSVCQYVIRYWIEEQSVGKCVIGEHAVIGAGSVVTHDVEPCTLVAGNPARKIRDIRQDD